MNLERAQLCEEDGEHCSNEARQFEAEGALDYIKVAAQPLFKGTLKSSVESLIPLNPRP